LLIVNLILQIPPIDVFFKLGLNCPGLETIFIVCVNMSAVDAQKINTDI